MQSLCNKVKAILWLINSFKLGKAFVINLSHDLNLAEKALHHRFIFSQMLHGEYLRSEPSSIIQASDFIDSGKTTSSQRSNGFKVFMESCLIQSLSKLSAPG